jgi:hypothetical protein
MPEGPAPTRGVPVGTLILLAVAAVLYVAMLSTITFSTGRGDASFGEALASLFATTGLWIALALLLIVGATMGEMPRWAGVVAVFLVPLSGVATFTAIDMCSRHIKWAIVFPVVLPLLIAAYALWARLPKVRAAISIEHVSATIWALVLILSGAALLTASII